MKSLLPTPTTCARAFAFACALVGAPSAFADPAITLTGDYPNGYEYTATSATTINLNGVTFTDAKMKLAGDVTFTINIVDGTQNTFSNENLKESCIKATKNSNIVFTGGGSLSLYSKKKYDGSEGVLTCNNLTVNGGDIRVEFDNDKSDSPCIFLKGSYVQNGGKMKVESSKKNCTNELYGVYFDSPGTKFTLNDGTFNAEIAGTKSRAINLKKTCTATFKGGSCKAEFEGPQGRFVHGGTIVVEGGDFNFVANVTDKMTEAYYPTSISAMKADYSITVKGGTFRANLPYAGSEVFTNDSETGTDVLISGGDFDLLSENDCIHATEYIRISGGTIRAVSTGDDALDANKGIRISGGDIRAYATAELAHGLDVNNGDSLQITGGIVVATDGVDAIAIGSDSTEVGKTVFSQATYYGAGLSTTEYSQKYLELEGTTNGVAFTVTPYLPKLPEGRLFNLLVSVPGRGDSPVEPKSPHEEITLSGPYTEDYEYTAQADTTVNLDGVDFSEAKLKLAGDVTFTINLVDGTQNVFSMTNRSESCIKATRSSNIVFTGGGSLSLYSRKKYDGTEGVLTCNDLIVSNGDIRVEFDNDKNNSACIFLAGNYLQTGGKVKVESSKKNCTNELYGVYFDSPGKTFTLEDGTFNAEIAGTKSRAINLKRTGAATFRGGSCKVEFEGPDGRFVHGGSVFVEGGEFSITTNITSKMTADYFPTGILAFKPDDSAVFSGGVFSVDLPLADSVFVDAATNITVSAGTFDVVSGGAAFHAGGNISVSGGEIRAASTGGDVFDAGRGIAVSGGEIRAYAAAEGARALDVGADDVLGISGGIVVATDGPGAAAVGQTDFVQSTYYGAGLPTADYSRKCLQLEGETNGVAFVMKEYLPRLADEGTFNLLVSLPGLVESSVVPTTPHEVITLTGPYTSDYEYNAMADTTVNLDGVSFTDAKLKLAGDFTFTINLVDGTTNTFRNETLEESCIKATKSSNIVFTGGGSLSLYAAKKYDGSEGVLTCNDLVVSNGEIRVEFGGDAGDSPCIFLKGSYLQTGGAVKVAALAENTSNEFYGVYFDTAGKTFTLEGGAFGAEFTGAKSRAVNQKKSGTATFRGGSVEARFAGPGGRFVHGGNVFVEGGAFDFSATVAETTAEAYRPTEISAFKPDDSIVFSGGDFSVDIPLAGSEFVNAATNITISAGTFDVVSGDDAFSAGEYIYVGGGTIRAASTGDDVFDANRGITVSGGDIRAFATAAGAHGFDVNQNDFLTIQGGVIVATDGLDAIAIGTPGSSEVGKTNLDASTYYGTGLSMSEYSRKYLSLAGESDGGQFALTTRLPELAGEGTFNLLVRVPGLAADSVTPKAPAEAYENAASYRPMQFEDEVTVSGQTITTKDGDEIEVPAHYTLSPSEGQTTTVSLTLNENATPVIAAEEEEDALPAVVVLDDGTVSVGVQTISGLTYSLLSAETPTAAADGWSPVGDSVTGDGEVKRLTAAADGSGAGFFKVRVND